MSIKLSWVLKLLNMLTCLPCAGTLYAMLQGGWEVEGISGPKGERGRWVRWGGSSVESVRPRLAGSLGGTGLRPMNGVVVWAGVQREQGCAGRRGSNGEIWRIDNGIKMICSCVEAGVVRWAAVVRTLPFRLILLRRCDAASAAASIIKVSPVPRHQLAPLAPLAVVIDLREETPFALL